MTSPTPRQLEVLLRKWTKERRVHLRRKLNKDPRLVAYNEGVSTGLGRAMADLIKLMR